MRKLPDAASLTPDELIERWTLWLKETQQEAFHLYSNRFVFENITAMFKTNEALRQEGGFVFDWLLRIFAAEHLISIRRELEKGGGYLTLSNFLIELAGHSEAVLTRSRYVAHYKNDDKQRGSQEFDGLPGATSRLPRGNDSLDYISADSIAARAKQLERDTDKVVRYANWFIAHRVREKKLNLTLAEMYRAVNRIFDTYALYHRMITGSVWMTRYPTRQYNWRAPFETAWIQRGFIEWEPPEEPDNA